MSGLAISYAMKAALVWLRNRGGDGVFGERSNSSVLIASGERAPIMRSTWTKLERSGLVERYATKRLRITEAGAALDLQHVIESRGRDDDLEDRP